MRLPDRAESVTRSGVCAGVRRGARPAQVRARRRTAARGRAESGKDTWRRDLPEAVGHARIRRGRPGLLPGCRFRDLDLPRALPASLRSLPLRDQSQKRQALRSAPGDRGGVCGRPDARHALLAHGAVRAPVARTRFASLWRMPPGSRRAFRGLYQRSEAEIDPPALRPGAPPGGAVRAAGIPGRSRGSRGVQPDGVSARAASSGWRSWRSAQANTSG